jgi:hypothetical protein
MAILTDLKLLPATFKALIRPASSARGRSLLIVVPYGNGHLCAKPIQDPEALGLSDVFQINATEGWFEHLDRPNDFLFVLCTDADGYRVHTSKVFEKQCFSFHDGQPSFRTDISQTKNARAIGNDGDAIGAVRVFVHHLEMFLDDSARCGYARRVPD